MALLQMKDLPWPALGKSQTTKLEHDYLLSDKGFSDREDLIVTAGTTVVLSNRANYGLVIVPNMGGYRY